MRVPREILEHILLRCDGSTLLCAQKADACLRDIIEYLGKKTRLWEWCCQEEIPPEQLVDYLPIYEVYGEEKWRHIYFNWHAWETHSACILEPLLCNNDLKNISCIALSSDHVAIGCEDGRLKLFTRHWKPIFEYRIVATKLTKLTFIGYQDYNNISHLNLCLVVAFLKGISILSFDGFRKSQYDILDVKSHSIYGNYICIEKVGGRMTIMEITGDFDRRDVKEVWFTRIYSPRCITSYKMWNGKCTFLINGSVSTLKYKKPGMTPIEEMEKVMNVKFYSPQMMDSSTTQIMRDNVIINIYKNAEKSSITSDLLEDYVEIVILGPDKKSSKKLFNTWDIFKSRITCTYLHGNSFLIGTSCGIVYLYQVNNWKKFNMRRYMSKQIVGKHPIIAMAGREKATERRFYVCSKFNIHEITVWIPCADQA